MKPFLCAFLIFLAGTASVRAGVTLPSPALVSLDAAERAFSDSSLTRGTRAAFLAYLTDDGILLHPRPINGRQYYLEMQAAGGVLTWKPTYVEVSSAGDLGYTTGPWEYRSKSVQDRPIAFGHYVSIWRMQDDGTWRVILDCGVRYGSPDTSAAHTITSMWESAPDEGPTFGPENSPPAASADRGRSALLDADRAFFDVWMEKGPEEAYGTRAVDGIRVYRLGSFPAAGLEAAAPLLRPKSELAVGGPDEAQISRSGDLGYTYGNLVYKQPADSDAPPDSASYLHIWRIERGLGWRMALDLVQPIPKAVQVVSPKPSPKPSPEPMKKPGE